MALDEQGLSPHYSSRSSEFSSHGDSTFFRIHLPPSPLDSDAINDAAPKPDDVKVIYTKSAFGNVFLQAELNDGDKPGRPA
jgi:hypothetical protein